MIIEDAEIAGLSADPANLRRHSPEQIDKLVASLRRFGQTLPLLADRCNVVRVGNARLEAMRKLGWSHCKIVRLDLSPSEWTALSIADNKLHDDSDFDEQALSKVLSALHAEDAELATVTGFSPDELAALLQSNNTGDGGQQADQSPEEFPKYDSDIATNSKCPKCGFEWQQSS